MSEGAAAAELDGAADAALISLYFACDTSHERDLLFERLRRRSSAAARDFLLAMLQHDEDEALRLDAAVELARRGEATGIAYLEARLARPQRADDFHFAVEALAPLQGERLYARLRAMWADAAVPAGARLQAMQALATVAPAQACADFVAFIGAQAAAAATVPLPEAELECAMAVCLRFEHGAALAPMQALQQRLGAQAAAAAATANAGGAGSSAEVLAEQQAFVAEAIALLTP